MSDLVTFGVIPASLIYSVGLRPLGLFGVVPVGSFVIAAAVRLARFNLLSAAGRSSSTRFVGLPVPGAAAIMASVAFATGAPTFLRRKFSAWSSSYDGLERLNDFANTLPGPENCPSSSGSFDNCRRRTLRCCNSVGCFYGLGRPIFCDSVRPLGAISRTSAGNSLRSSTRPSDLINTIDRPPASGFYYGAKTFRAGTSSTNLIVSKRER